MNKDKIDRFDTDFFKRLKTQKEKEKYFLNYVRKTLGIMERGERKNVN